MKQPMASVRKEKISKRYFLLSAFLSIFVLAAFSGCPPKNVNIDPNDQSPPEIIFTHYNGEDTSTIQFDNPDESPRVFGWSTRANIFTCTAKDGESGVKSLKMAVGIHRVWCEKGEELEQYNLPGTALIHFHPMINTTSSDEGGMAPTELKATKIFNPEVIVGFHCGGMLGDLDGYYVKNPLSAMLINCQAVNHNGLTETRSFWVTFTGNL